jgi:hypothetical protein
MRARACICVWCKRSRYLQTSSARTLSAKDAAPPARAADEPARVPESDGGAASGGSDDDVDNEAAIVAARLKMRANPNVLPSSVGLSLDETRWRKRHALEPADKVCAYARACVRAVVACSYL